MTADENLGSNIPGQTTEPNTVPWYAVSTAASVAFLAMTTISGFVALFIMTILSIAGIFPRSQTLHWLITLTLLLGGPLLLQKANTQKAQFDAAAAAQVVQDQLELKRAQASAWAAWAKNRPLAIVAESPAPLHEMQNQISSRGGTFSIGMNPTTEELHVVQRNQSALLVGPTQCGKTTGVGIPAVLTASGAVIVASTKTDIMRKTKSIRESKGRCWYLDLTGTAKRSLVESMTRAFWTPLGQIHDLTDSISMARSVVAATPVGRAATSAEAHWKITAEQLLAGLLFAAFLHRDATMATIYKWVQTKDFDTPIQILTEVDADRNHPHRGEVELALNSISAYLDDDPRHMESVRSTTLTVLDSYKLPAVNKNADKHNFDPDAFVASTDTLYIVADANTQAMTAPIVAGLLDTIYLSVRALQEISDFGETTRPPLLVVLDEAANISPTQQIPLYLSEGPGQGFQLLLMFQNLAQASKVWPEQGRAILDLPAIKIIFGGISDAETLEAFSAMGGDLYRQYVSLNTSESMGTSKGNSQGRNYGFQSTSRSVGSNQGTSTQSTFGTSTNYQKERYLSTGDISTLPNYHAFMVARDGWQVLKLAATSHPAWQAVFADSTEAPHDLSAPGQLDRQVPLLPTLQDLYQRAREPIESEADYKPKTGAKSKSKKGNTRGATSKK